MITTLHRGVQPNIHAKSGGQLGYIPANFFGFSAKFQAENAKSILHPSHRLRQHHLRWRQHHLRWRQHHFRWKQHHFLSIFTIFCRFSPFFIDFHDLRTFVAIYILSRFTHFFRKFILAKIAFSATSHVFCMYEAKVSGGGTKPGKAQPSTR